MRSPRFVPVIALAVLLSALAGGFFGSTVLAKQDQVQLQYRAFTAALAAVDREYVDNVPSDRLVYGAIDGMLHTLDPHSSFFDPKQYAQMRERQEGSYYGVGLSIQTVDGDVTVVSVFEGSPAYRAGIRRGDVIARVKGQDAKNWTTEQTAHELKGPKGTKVNISIRRPGYDKLIDMDVERDQVNITTVRGAFMIDPQTGYIKLGDFSETSDHEVGEAIAKLEARGMKRLVFDLRDNPGGPLDQAIRIANRFLPRGDMIVYTRGRIANADEDYRGTENADYSGPMMVLVNRNSASASEIVTGSLQDHDRALIVGETTFGKGLVQTVFPISEDTGLALTTYHYYTPSGRLIQRSYDGVSLYDYYYVRDDAKKADKSNTEVKLTDSGRTVYGGGGITPDEKINVPDLNRFQISLLQHYIFVSSGIGTFDKHYLTTHTVGRDFVVDDAVMQQFKDFLRTNNIEYTDADITGSQDWIKSNIKAELFTSQFGQLEGLRVRAESDPEIIKAVTHLPEALALVDRNTKGQQNTASLH
jgi:carboxyl-terminal processing protease